MIKNFVFIFLILFYELVFSSQDNALPSCYAVAKLQQPRSPEIEIFVAIDQTTPFDSKLKQQVADSIRHFLAPGNAFTIFEFSAFIQGRYVNVVASGKLDPPMDATKRNDVPKIDLAKFDRCMATAPKYAAVLVGQALRTIFDASSSRIAKTDILAALKEISKRVRDSNAREKVVLVASDMLENSSITSFYQKNSVRKIDPEVEIKKAVESGMVGDFGGARVYVIGAGVLDEKKVSTKGVYHDPKTMAALEFFWRNWFSKSNANLVAFGAPALLVPVQ